MTVQFLGLPKVQYFDSNGDPLTGGKLHTYEPGTTTNKASYPTVADAEAGTNANTNPVILDSRGEADVVLAGNTKLVLKTSADVTIWTLDNVNPSTTLMDSNGNEQIKYTTTSSAVNELTIANAATGNGPTISATGDDTNVDINIVPKGSGNVVITNLTATLTSTTPLTVDGTASSAAEIRLAEDTDNGTNYLAFKSPSAITTSTTWSLPDGDGADTQVLKTDGSSTLAWADAEDLVIAASDSVAGKIEIAVQSEMETGSDTSLAVTPGRQQYHPSAAKFWVKFNGSGTAAISSSYNVTSLVDNGTGNYTVNIATDFSSANWCATMTTGTSFNTSDAKAISAQAAGSISILIASNGTPVDEAIVCIAGFGDQA